MVSKILFFFFFFFWHESVEKLGVSLVISEYALKYSGLEVLSAQKEVSDATKQYKESKIFPVEHAPGPP